MKYSGFVVAALFAVAVAGGREMRGALQQAGGGSAEAVPPAPLDGPGLFRERGCAQCHAIGGLGEHKGPDLSGVGRRLKKDGIERQIVQGGGAMPAFGEVLSAAETATLVRYLQHCREREPGK